MITRASDPVPTEAQRIEQWRARMAKQGLPTVRNPTLYRIAFGYQIVEHSQHRRE